MAGYVLRLFSPVKTGQGFVEDVTAQARSWRRSTRMQGGFWQGSFTVEGELAELQKWFYDRLGYHVEERAAGGQVTWEGLIYELELSYGGVKRRRSLELMQNAVRARFTQYEGHTANTEWQSTAASIARYGRKEELLALEAMDATAAGYQVGTTLKHNGWPYPRAVGIEAGQSGKGEASLTVSVCGYAFCCNWRYVSQAWSWQDGTATTTLNAWISELATTDLTEFISVGWTRANALTVQKYVREPVRVWDLMSELVKMGDSSGNLWRLHVGAGRRLYYEQVDVTPRLYWRQGGLFTSAGSQASTSPYTVQPGVVRDLEYPASRTEPGSILTDARDVLVDEVEIDGEGQISLKTELWSDADLLASQASAAKDYRDWMQDYWSKAWELDLEKRKAAWKETHPIWEPFVP